MEKCETTRIAEHSTNISTISTNKHQILTLAITSSVLLNNTSEEKVNFFTFELKTGLKAHSQSTTSS